MGKFPLFQFSCFLAAFIYCYAAENNSEKFRKTYERNNAITTFNNDLQTFLMDEFLNSKWNFIFENTDLNFAQISSKCLNDINFILSNSGDPWRLPILSYSGKPDSSFFKGNTKFPGNYNGCIRLKSRNSNASFGNFNGKYCTLLMLLKVSEPFDSNILLPFLNGFCVPDTCSTDDLESILKSLKSSSALSDLVNYTKLSCKSTEWSLNAPSKGVLAVLSLFCVLALLGSSFAIVDYAKSFIKQSPTFNVSDRDCSEEDPDYKYKNSNDDVSFPTADLPNGNCGLSKVKQILQCFCIFTNGAKLVNTDSSDREMLFLHGVRFLNTSWIILSHTYLFSFFLTENAFDFTTSHDYFLYQIPLQGSYAVDSFFLLSAFLLAYYTTKKISETKGVSAFPWRYLYIHRYIRISSTYFIVTGFFATLFMYAGSGPFWPEISDNPCTKKWWWNLLYINNFNEIEDMCMCWSWFLANDMQFFVISPLFLIALWRRPKTGLLLLTTFLVACCFANFFISYHSNLLVGNGERMKYAAITGNIVKALIPNEIYTKPYSRMSPYLIGIALGYICFKQRINYKPKHGSLFLSIGWVLAMTLILAAVFGLYNNDLDLLASCIYNSFHRIAFALGESWVIYVCAIGQGGRVDKILSWKLFIPLSRLTYTVYLIHPMILVWYLLSLKTNFYFSHITVLLLYIGFLVASHVLALPVSLIYEYPIVRLEKLLMLRNHSQRKEKQLGRHDKEL